MILRVALLATIVTLAAVPPAMAQRSAPNLVGTWKFDLHQGPRAEGPRVVVVREDSSASYGEETARWRLAGDSLWLAIGGEWEVYGLKVRGTRMTLSGGDLTDPIVFDRTGPATPRGPGVAVPPDPRKRAAL